MKLSKGLYVGTYAAWLVSIVIAAIIQVVINNNQSLQQDASGIFLGALSVLMGTISALLTFAAIFLWLRLFYKAWKAIQDGYARTTPGKAVGFLFIPFFLAYWMFECIWGFAKDYNKFIERHSIYAERLPETFFLINVIVRCLWIIPVVNVIAIMATIILNLPMMWMICNAVNAIPEREASAETAYAPA